MAGTKSASQKWDGINLLYGWDIDDKWSSIQETDISLELFGNRIWRVKKKNQAQPRFIEQMVCLGSSQFNDNSKRKTTHHINGLE